MLRFKNDDGIDFPDWEEKSFGDFLITHSEKTSDKDSYPLYSLTIESGVQPKTERYEREFLVKKEGDNYKIVPPNAFVYNPMNLRFGALKVNHEKFSVSVSGYYDVFSLKDDSTLAFWENYLVTPRMLNYYFSIATGSLIEKLRVHYSQFVKIKKAVPSFPEQQKIEDFLSTIDTVIEKQKATVEAWEERKKGVMQKLFSQEVRFKADDGSDFPDWEEKPFGEIFEKTSNKNTCYGTDKIISVANMYFKDNATVSNEDYLKTYNVMLYGDIAFEGNKSKKFLHGRLVANTIGDGIVSHVFDVFHPINQAVYYLPYWKEYINYEPVMGRILVRCTKSSTMMTNLVTKDFLKETIMVPCLAEQQKIADCLLALDDVIEKQKATLAAWEEMKKGLLQQMFV